MLYHLAPNGRIGLVLANGALFNKAGGEGEIRRNIIQDDKVEGIIALPTQLFYSVQIPVTLWFFNKNKKNKGKVLFIDARKMGHMVDRTHRDFSEKDIDLLVKTFEQYENNTLNDVRGFCCIKSLDEIDKEDNILTPALYVGTEEKQNDGISYEEKMTNLISEMGALMSESEELNKKIRKILKDFGYDLK